MEVGIAGYGAYVPRHRIKVEEIARVWGADAPAYKKGLRLQEKSVPSPDQDTITMSIEAARHALARAGIDPTRLGAVYVGSESHPYAVKPSGTVVAEAVGATPEPSCARAPPTACSPSVPTPRRGRPATRSSTRPRRGRRPSSSLESAPSPCASTRTPT